MTSHSIARASTASMNEHESQDFMSVDSFSQLPFIRPSSKPSTSPSAAIRLFGFDFPPDPPSEEKKSAPTETTASAATAETGRKFECHYCCRNFPTSQALGGHQNAHKRERQHAKRAHLQSAMAAANAHHGLMADSHMYGILNYHRLGPNPVVQHGSAARFGIEYPACPPTQYTSWSSSGGGGARFYGGLGSVSQPITGSPLPGLWRVPSGAMGVVVQQDTTRPMPLPLFGGDLDSKPPIVSVSPNVVGVASSFSSSTTSSSASQPQDLRGCESGAKDQTVSLDLHL